ncbi:MAG: SsgA family sporulation/cell division regulator [Actinomycetota bacterium]|nr:SsgA family sporulation/cell division regulator [Actinomycetota bacterium]
MRDRVTAEVVVADRHLSGRGRTTTLRLNWSAGDPLAVHLHLTATPDHPSLPRGSWVVLRDFLRYGLDEPTGDGAVRIAPHPVRNRVRLDLARDCGTCWVTVPAQAVRDFLDATEQLVPAGQKRGDQALDDLIARLLVDG